MWHQVHSEAHQVPSQLPQPQVWKLKRQKREQGGEGLRACLRWGLLGWTLHLCQGKMHLRQLCYCPAPPAPPLPLCRVSISGQVLDAAREMRMRI